MRSFCFTEQDPNTVPQGGSDVSFTAPLSLALHSLTDGTSTVPEFKVEPIEPSSLAFGIGRDDQYGCSNAAINHQDQNVAPRPAI